MYLSTFDLYFDLKLPCFVISLVMGPDTVYQVLGFIVVISKNYIAIVTLFRCLWEMVSSTLFVSTAVVLQCAWISSNVCLVRFPVGCHILCILCFHWFELLHIMYFGFRIISLCSSNYSLCKMLHFVKSNDDVL